MGKLKVAIVLFGAFLALCTKVVLRVEGSASSSLQKEIEAKLKVLNKPAIKTIKSEDGDIIDCVNIYKQPAFDHPALKNHTIQTWQKSGSCPKGTVPIRRILKEDLLRAASLDSFGRQPPEVFINSTNSDSAKLNGTNAYPENRTASYLFTTLYNYIGAEADINLWNPRVDLPDDFTTAQLRLKAGGDSTTDFQSVETGWMVNPKLYGDRATRLFISWTKDSYKTTGCFDLTCPGFVATGQLALGATFSAISSQSGKQYEFNAAIVWDSSSGNWWVKVNNNMTVGYFPGKLFGPGGLQHSATSVEFGGQVYSPQIGKKPHTATAMGSGEFATGRLGFACYMRNYLIKDYSQQLKYPPYAQVTSEEPDCYDAVNDVQPREEPYFFFGGPGRKPPYCP
ncbi:hypothetical protein SESBI_12405 [Sesbania bispinosa]|nr:hypothetical protein SESBI_12405 [Sesbania bispinosa]